MQVQTNKYTELLMNCHEKKHKVIIGCGNQKRDGWIGLDQGDYGQEIVRDLRQGMPFCDNSCDELFADQVLEHIQDNEDFIFIMNECLRVLCHGGTFDIRVPMFSSYTFAKDPTHVRKFAKETFSYLQPENTWHYGFDKRWRVEKAEQKDDQLFFILRAEKDKYTKPLY